MPAEVRLFGGAAIIAPDGRPLSGAAAQPRRVAVLAVLADAWPSTVTRDRLVGLIWPETDDAGARRLLTQALYALRRELGDGAIVAGTDVAIDAAHLRVDLVEFRRALAAHDLDAAIALHRGPALDGFHPRGAPDFERWADALRERTQRELREALGARIRRHVASHELRDAVRWSERRVETSPFDADAILELIGLHEDLGDADAALLAADGYAQRMRAELEIEPAPSVQARADALRARGADAGVARAARTVTAPATVQPMEIVRELSRAPSVEPTSRSVRWLLGAAAAIALGVALFAWRGRQTAADAAEPRTIALERFAVRGDAVEGARAVDAIRAVLGSALDGSAGVRVADAPLPHGWATLGGRATLAGASVRLDAELRAPRGDSLLASASVSGSRDSVLVLAERLAVALLPALYRDRAGPLDTLALRRFTRARALRHELDGEVAFRRGAFERAYDEFKSATELDSAQAWAWYRRAVAAEEVHRGADADSSAAIGAASAQTVADHERRLLGGYARWRAGDARGADSVFRALAADQSPDREAWFQLAEVGYHAGPLLGRPVEASVDPWRRVLALDPGNVPALVHLVRLEARAGRTDALDVLKRAWPAGASGIPLLESRVIAAHAGGAHPAAALIDSLPDFSLHFVHAIVAGMVERPDDARIFAARMTAPSRPDAIRGEGHIALAHLAMAGGRWRAAWAELDSAERFDAVAAAWTRAYFATLPFVTLPDSVVVDAASRLAGAPARSMAAPLYLAIAVDAPAAPVIQRYLQTLAARTSGAAPSEPLTCGGTGGAPVRALCADLRLGLDADAAVRAGQDDRAIARLDGLSMSVPYQFAGRSVYFARTRERYLRAEALARSGRDIQAIDQLTATSLPSRYDYLYLAPARLRRAQIHEKRGDLASAAADYRTVLAVWRDPDAEAAWVRREAQTGLTRVTARR